ncbi:GNAT family N-acetyltransferase [Gordonia crocea]|uniref:N-acetyltransferase n=1 Tax=Gordonia crocea TaxID=589162 RepID=A0A7I9UZL1_9ACTN|nr:N-acetyltransferase [Gordonia crocea]GED98260.1 N-acetyltransferase [Gordonia crocea]
MGDDAPMIIRPEEPRDVPAIDAVHRSAFGGPDGSPDGGNEGDGEPGEVGLVHRLRDDRLLVVSLVAEPPDGAVVGHVCLSRGDLAGTRASGLGPLGVRPDVQRTGVGSALMHAALAAAQAAGEAVVLLLGDPAYYARFGFGPAASLGISPDVAQWAGPHFQAHRLGDGTVPAGVFRYAEPFYSL